MDDIESMDLLRRLARGLTRQFGGDVEVVLHDLSEETRESTIVAIENGHVTGRKVGDGPSQVVLEALQSGEMEDRLNYYTKTSDGRILRSSTIFIKNKEGKAIGVFSINHDISRLLAVERTVRTLVNGAGEVREQATRIPMNVNELLDQLIEQSVKLVGRPAALMTKEEKMRAVQFLSDAGAFLITRSSDKVSKFFGISKYTLYSYFDAKEAKTDV